MSLDTTHLVHGDATQLTACPAALPRGTEGACYCHRRGGKAKAGFCCRERERVTCWVVFQHHTLF